MNIDWATTTAILALAAIGIVAFVLIWRARKDSRRAMND